MATYSPQPAVTINNVEELRQWVEEEFASLSRAFNELSQVIELKPVYKAPDVIKDGMLIFADGTSFNPGAGRGTYERKAGAWVKL